MPFSGRVKVPNCRECDIFIFCYSWGFATDNGLSGAIAEITRLRAHNRREDSAEQISTTTCVAKPVFVFVDRTGSSRLPRLRCTRQLIGIKEKKKGRENGNKAVYTH